VAYAGFLAKASLSGPVRWELGQKEFLFLWPQRAAGHEPIGCLYANLLAQASNARRITDWARSVGTRSWRVAAQIGFAF